MTKAIRLDQPTYYQVLGIEEDAEPDEAAQRCHPDRNLNDPTATEAFQGIQEAYEVLSDPERRSFYDEELESLRNPHPLPSPPVCCSSFSSFATANRPSAVRVPARPIFAQPPPFHPLHGAPMMMPSPELIWFKSRLIHRAPPLRKIHHSYWRPPVQAIPIRPFPPLPSEYAQKMMADMEAHLARLRWLADARARGARI